MITASTTGSWDKTEKSLRKLRDGQIFQSLQRYAEKGRTALSEATPTDTGLAAGSWKVSVVKRRGSWEIIWSNTDQESGFPVAIMLQYGYSTGTGGYVRGRDYINPVIKPLFDEIENAVWKEVTSA